MSLHPIIPHYQLYGQKEVSSDTLSVHIQTIDAFNEKYGHHHHAHRHPHLYQMVWVTKGSGIHTMDTATYKLRPNCLYTLSPGIVHTCQNSAEIEGYILHFSPDFMVAHSRSPITNTFHFGQANAPDNQQITNTFQQILEEFSQIRKGRAKLIQSLISILLVYKDRLVQPTNSNDSLDKKQVINQQFQLLVNQHFATHKRLQFYANTLHISIPYLKENIKNATGISASELIKKRVILEAKRQLIYSKLTISEVAYLLGFSDANYFWKYFRRLVGQSPGDFRKEHSPTNLSNE